MRVFQTAAAFGTYLAFALSSFLAVWFCPPQLSRDFLASYSAANLVFSLLTYLFYTNGRWKTFDLTAIAMGVAGVTGALAFDLPILLFCLLAFTTLIADYSGSQAFSPLGVAFARLFMALAAVLLLADFMLFLVVRIALALAVMGAAVVLKDYARRNDATDNPRPSWPTRGKVAMVAASNAAYFGPLFVIGYLDAPYAKQWYIAYSICATVVLRIVDFEIKGRATRSDFRFSAGFIVAIACAASGIAGYAALSDVRYMVLLSALPVFALIRKGYMRETWH